MSMWLFGEKFYVAELFAFVILVLGTLIYNEIIILPIAIFNKNTTREMNKRARKNSGLLDEDGTTGLISNPDSKYISMSPHAAYDQNRNVRNIEK